MSPRSPRFDCSLPSEPIRAYRLDGVYDFKGESSKSGQLRSARILEDKQLTLTQDARVRSVFTEVASFGGEGARCFIPGLGFTIGEGAEKVEILVCLKCYWAYFFRGDTQTVEALSDLGYRQLYEIYVDLFPAGDPAAA